MQKLLKQAEEELESINAYPANHQKTNLENVYDNLNQYRKEIVTPLVFTDEMYAEKWDNEEYVTNPGS